MASFGLEGDRGLVRLGAMVRALDVGVAFLAEHPFFDRTVQHDGQPIGRRD